MSNASIGSILRGLKPRIRQELGGTEYFQFHSGQVRRQIGYGHSTIERRARRMAGRLQQRLGARSVPAGAIAAGIVARQFGVEAPRA